MECVFDTKQLAKQNSKWPHSGGLMDLQSHAIPGTSTEEHVV